jgi:amino acid transporter
MTVVGVPRTLARRTMGAGTASVFAVIASAPMVVLAGGIPAMYATTGVIGIPLSFAVVAVVVALLASGYVAMAAQIRHPAPFYALVGRGISPSAGMGAAVLALLAYNCIQISLYGLVGTTMAAVFGGAWQVWAWAVWLLVGVLGWTGGAFAAKVLGWLLAAEVTVIVCFVWTGFAHAANGVSWVGLAPSRLLAPGVSGVLAFAMAAMVGVETPAVFAEEGRSRAVGKAVGIAVAVTTVLYVAAALAYQEWTGPGQVAAAAASPDRGPLALLGGVFGPAFTVVATFLVGTSAVASMSAFHAAAARYAFGLARERVLPGRVARVSRAGAVMRGGAPLGGSLLQSGVAALALTVAMAVGADPMTVIFTWLSTIAAVAVLSLLIVTAVASMLWFSRPQVLSWSPPTDRIGRSKGQPRRRGVAATGWSRYLAAGMGAILGLVVLAMMLINLSALLGTPPGSRLPLLVPVIIAITAVAGLIWALLLRVTRHPVWDGIGRGTPTSLTVKDDRLARVKV